MYVFCEFLFCSCLQHGWWLRTHPPSLIICGCINAPVGMASKVHADFACIISRAPLYRILSALAWYSAVHCLTLVTRYTRGIGDFHLSIREGCHMCNMLSTAWLEIDSIMLYATRVSAFALSQRMFQIGCTRYASALHHTALHKYWELHFTRVVLPWCMYNLI